MSDQSFTIVNIETQARTSSSSLIVN